MASGRRVDVDGFPSSKRASKARAIGRQRSGETLDDVVKQAAFDLAAEHFSRMTGQHVEPSEIAFGRPPNSLGEFLDVLLARFGSLTDTQCPAVVYYIFPAFRPMLDDAFAKNGLVWPSDPKEWRTMALGALVAAWERGNQR